MAKIDELTLRQLCEKASSEPDSKKLLELVAQINGLLDRGKDRKDDGEPDPGMKHAS